jgi:hypothetical protein
VLIEIATAIGQRAATSATQILLRDLLGVQDRQLEALQAIRQDVRTLLEGPWRRAKLLLAEAAEASDKDIRDSYLRDAKTALFEAVSHEPSATPRRATVAADLAIVLGMLSERQASLRWARTAHDDQTEAVRLAIFSAIKTLNSRLQALKAPIDGDFWEFVARARKSSPSETQTWLRERYELGREQEEIWQEHTFRFVLEPGIGRLVTAETMTEGGRKLIELHRMSHDVREYRDVCLAFDPQVKVPEPRSTA